ncbi:sensor histidine kinase [Clostridium lundense]|uniref:sensor histidine kinase n=1 Tax=Clostridium lundense TaxID=319475 RepID=UPI000487063C|nr:sensor histidine kinase [Clostridium lundense]
MNLKEYFLDKRYFIIFYIVLMMFISAIVYLDGTIQVNIYNIIYINIVGATLTTTYLLGEYFFNKKYYNAIKYILENRDEDIVYSLPEPKGLRQLLNNKMLIHVYKNEEVKIKKLYEEKRNNSEFITSWVHEIKTPIAVTRLVLENSFGKPKEEILNSIEEEIDKIDNYVEQALYYSKIDDFSKDYFISEHNLEKIVKTHITKHAKLFINKRIKIEINDVDFIVSTDKKWLGFIIDQILSNSLKYTSESGIIKISGEKLNKEKILIIEDNGIGIKEEDIERVFHRGFTGHNGREMYKSTGMGLYLAKELSKKLGHYISIESSYGEYTKVKIHFPKLTDYFNIAKM